MKTRVSIGSESDGLPQARCRGVANCDNWQRWVALAAARLSRLIVALGAAAGLMTTGAIAGDTHVTFDVPDKIQCRDVTPDKCGAVHPHMKVIEAKFRISATFVEGSESNIADMVYVVSSPGMRLKVLDYFPNTTLESTLENDAIAVVDSTESTDGLTGDAHVGYEILSLGGAKSQSSKRSASSTYQKIAPKALVLASGTTNRGHGVFYKLRPSNGASLEGAKEFFLLAHVPKTWRGDWITIVCSARANKKSLVSNSVHLAGVEHAHVGLCLDGDAEANALAEQMTAIQGAHNGLLAKKLAEDAARMPELLHATAGGGASGHSHDDWLSKVVRLNREQKSELLDDARRALATHEERLGWLANP